MKVLYIEDNSDLEDLLKSYTSSSLDQDGNISTSLPVVDYVVSPINIWKSLLSLYKDVPLSISNVKDTSKSDFLNVGSLRINKFANEVYFIDKKVCLSRREYDLLNTIVANHPRITTIDRIRISVWKEYGHLMSNTIEVHINRINKKLGSKVLKCVKGFGYKLSDL